MSGIEWTLSGGMFLTGDGSLVSSQSVYEKLRENNGEEIRGHFPDLQFSKRPVYCSLHLVGKFPDLLTIGLCVERHGAIFVLQENQDQIVIEGKWFGVHSDSIAQALSVLLSHGLTSGSITLGQYIDLMADAEAAYLVVDETEESEDVVSWAVENKLSTPPGLQANLHPYQLTGSTMLRVFANNDVGCLLADEMGLGKTMQVITLLLDVAGKGPNLVVAPASLIYNWEREIATFAPSLTTLVHAGSRRSGDARHLEGFDVVICSYETLDSDKLWMAQIQWNVVALDEAQNIRNPEAKRSVAVKSVKCHIPVAVTGTPVENYLQDLWSIYEFVLPQLLGSRERFEEVFPDKVSAAYELGKLIAKFTIRRKLEDVKLELPARTDSFVPFPAPPIVSDEHEELEAHRNQLAVQTRMRMLCAHADVDLSFEEFAKMPKVDRLLDMAEEIYNQNQKILVFASYTETIDRLRDLFLVTYPNAHVDMIRGDIPVQERLEIVDRFNADPKPGCLFLIPQAGGTGLTITGANHVVHFNPEWNPALTEQATKRAHRIGSELPVFVSHFYYLDTVEERVIEKADDKRDKARGVDDGIKDEQQDDGEP